MEQEDVRVCQQCDSDTRRSGLRELEGICIQCWHDKATAAADQPKVPDGLLDDIDELKRIYGNNLAIAPGAVRRIVAYADKARGRETSGVDAISRAARVQR